jgi:hypothetical protein
MKMKLQMKSMTVVAAFLITAGAGNVGFAAGTDSQNPSINGLSYTEPDLVHDLPCANSAPRTKARYAEEHLYRAAPGTDAVAPIAFVNNAPKTKAKYVARSSSPVTDPDHAHNLVYINNAPRTKAAQRLETVPVEIAPLK